MKKMKFQIGDIVQFGTIKTKVVKSNATGGCRGCALFALCNSIYDNNVPITIEKEFNKLTGGCFGIDIDGKRWSVRFEKIIETKEE